MIVRVKELEDGTWKARGYPRIFGYGATKDEAVNDYFDKQAEYAKKLIEKQGWAPLDFGGALIVEE